ncbi:aminoglycoside phosphotransferase family protein [Streptomyces sp. NPDC052396]|uniref:aminoglycoside phosphotransferase family protein n=1 Tax=Streptomyces sp. NPDC052396 TaxID=3365689 RepID=UPI0037D3CD52
MLLIPEGFAQHTIDREGEPGRAWLASLPDLADELLHRWQCVRTTDPVVHGMVGLVLPVHRADGTPAMLKISFPHHGNVHEPDAFAAWRGRGAVRLLERDDPRFAMLLERAGESTLAQLPSADEAMAVAGQLARRLAVPAPPALPRLRDRIPEWQEQLPKDAARLGHPLPARTLDAALATLRELGPDQPDTLLHGDLHANNVLRADREPWLAVDPKGWAGDPAYDAYTTLRSRAHDLLTATDVRTALLRRLTIFAEAADCAPERAVRWAQFRATMAAHWGRDNGEPEWMVAAYETMAGLLA